MTFTDDLNKVVEFWKGQEHIICPANMDNIMCFVPAVNLCVKK